MRKIQDVSTEVLQDQLQALNSEDLDLNICSVDTTSCNGPGEQLQFCYNCSYVWFEGDVCRLDITEEQRLKWIDGITEELATRRIVS
jgi:hypothetical protein